ncbi:hypothetical protein GCM10009865_36120 [Aeromicrobium ponti]
MGICLFITFPNGLHSSNDSFSIALFNEQIPFGMEPNNCSADFFHCTEVDDYDSFLSFEED